MPLDFRYHIASLTAVFGALLIGVLLGVAMSDAPSLREQMRKLRDDFRRSQVLRNIDQRTDQFNVRVEPTLVRNRLLGRNVALVYDVSAFPEQQVSAVHDSLTLAGANIALEIAFKPALQQVTPEQLTQLYHDAQLPETAKPTLSDLMEHLGETIGHGDLPTLPALQNARLLRAKGDLKAPVSIVILLGGSVPAAGPSLQQCDLPFLSGCKTGGLRVAAAERLEAAPSAIPAFRKIVPTTVDNIDHAAGRIALILALAEDQPGHYGYKPTAQDVAPDIE